jgi:hypothetical protein
MFVRRSGARSMNIGELGKVIPSMPVATLRLKLFRPPSYRASSSGVIEFFRRGHFTPGHSEYAANRRRIAEKVRQLELDYDPSPSQQLLLPVIAAHLDEAERSRRSVTRVRASNAAKRLLADIPRKPEPPPPTLAAYERRKQQEAAS